MNDLFGKALFDYYKDNRNTPLLLHNKFSKPDELDLEGYFFEESYFSDLEHYALELCRGKILDIGAAAGRHCLNLQENGHDVTGLDASDYCCQLMKLRGVEKIRCADIFDFREQGFDTLLLLMNGIGLAGDIAGLGRFLQKARQMLNKNGQIIFDSSDVAHLKKTYKLPPKNYFGEIDYQYEYEGINGQWFTWLYVDPGTLGKIAHSFGWFTQIIFQDEDSQYLAKLSRH